MLRLRLRARIHALPGVLALVALAGAFLVGTGCSTPKSASAHRKLAAIEDAKAAEHRALYDEDASAIALRRADDNDVLIAESYNPTHWQQAAADAHSRAAERHRAAARALEQSEDAACVGVAPAARAACPLLLPIDVVDTPRGVRVAFADVATAERAAAVVRCQQAFAVTRGFADLPSCALYARKLKVTLEGAVLVLEASDDAGVERLRANVRRHEAD